VCAVLVKAGKDSLCLTRGDVRTAYNARTLHGILGLEASDVYQNPTPASMPPASMPFAPKPPAFRPPVLAATPLATIESALQTISSPARGAGKRCLDAL